jgi:hypothetical protein
MLKTLHYGQELILFVNLDKPGIKTVATETPFTTWDSLPYRALLSIKWHLENGKAYWHWVIFVRENTGLSYVLDLKVSLIIISEQTFGI